MTALGRIIAVVILFTVAAGAQAGMRDNPKRLQPIGPNLTAIAMSPDGRHLASASSRGWLSLWDLASGTAIRNFKAHDDDILLLRFTSDGSSLLSGGSDEIAKLWRVPDLANPQTFETEGRVTGGAVTRDGSEVLLGLWDGRIDVRKIADGTRVKLFQAHMFGHVSVEMSPSGARFVSSGSDQTIRLWDTATFEQIRYLKNGAYGIKAHKGIPYGLRFLDEDRLLSSASIGISTLDTLVLWDVNTGKRLKHLSGVAGQSGIAVSADGKRLVYADHHQNIWQVFVFDVANWRQERAIPLADYVKLVEIGANGKLVVTGSLGGRVGFWDADTGHRLISAWSRFDREVGAELPEGTVLRGKTGAAAIARTLAPYLMDGQ